MSTFTELIKNRIVLAGLAVMLVSYIFNAPYLALIYGFFLGALVLVLPKKLNTSVLFRATLSIVLVLTIFQITTILFYAVKVPVDALAIHTVTILVLTLVSYARGIRFSDVKSLTVSVDDLKIIIAPVVITVIVVTGILNMERGAGTSVLSSFLYASDNGAHIEMFSLNVRNDANLFKTDYEFVQSDNEFAYPMGWHNAASVVFRSFVVNVDDIPFIHIIYGYFALFIATLFLALLSLSLFTFYFYTRYSKGSKLASVVVPTIITSIIGFLLIFPLYKMGFFNYVPILAYILLSSALLLNVATKKELFTATLLLLVMACGVCASWVLVFPVYILFSVVVIAYFLKIKLRREALYLGFATLGAVLIGLILLHKSTLGGISTDTLSVGGGLPQTFDDLFVTATVVFGIIYLAKNKIFAKNTVNAFALLLGSVLIGVVVLKLYFLVQGYELSYYYTKFSYILTVLCAVILFATVAIWTEGRKYASLPIATAALFLIGTYGSNFTSMTHWAQYINTSQYLSGSVSEVILHEFSKPYNKDGQYIYAVYDGEPGVAEIFSRLVNINKYKNENDCTNDMRQVRGSMEDSKRVKIEKSCPGVILSLNDGAIYK